MYSTTAGSGPEAPAGARNQPLIGWPAKPLNVTSSTLTVRSGVSTRSNRGGVRRRARTRQRVGPERVEVVGLRPRRAERAKLVEGQVEGAHRRVIVPEAGRPAPGLLDARRRHVVVAIDQLDGRADERELRRQRQVRRRPADEDPDRAGLDDAPEVDVEVGELLRRQPEGDGPALARLEVEPLEPAQLLDRAGDRRLLVADVELDDLVAGPRRRCS